jgi:hypothetical protein
MLKEVSILRKWRKFQSSGFADQFCLYENLIELGQAATVALIVVIQRCYEKVYIAVRAGFSAPKRTCCVDASFVFADFNTFD